MSGTLKVFKNRTNRVPVELGFDVSADTIESEIRVGKSSESELIATWTVDFLTDGTDGKLVLTLDDSLLAGELPDVAYMDMKRISGGEPIGVFTDPIRVKFRDTVTE